MKKHWIKRGLLFVVIGIAAVFLFGLLVMSLWNALLPEILGVKAITFIQALGILLLSKILFGGFGGKGYRGGRGYEWRKKMKEKWNTMTPEEREQFKSEWKHRCGGRWNMPEQNPQQQSASE
jgi:hypothetical protein